VKYWPYIKDRLKNHIELAMSLLLLALGAYVFVMAEKYRVGKILIIFVGLLVWLLRRDKTNHLSLLITFFALLVFDLFYAYFWLANHHFMLLFMVLAVILYAYHKRNDILEKNIQILLFIVLVMSAFQKVFSSQFMSGDFYYFMANRGYLFNIFISFSPESLAVLKSNSQSVAELQATDPNLGQIIVLKDLFPNTDKFSLIYAWITVVVEFLVAAAILWKPKSTWTHILFIMLILGILCARLETGFMALLGICGIFLCRNSKLRLFYVLIVIGCIAFIVTKRGYH
jgi:hypothetical protein